MYFNRRWVALKNAEEVKNTALVYAVTIHLVEQRPEAHAEPLGRLAAVPTRRGQGRRDRLALRDLPCVLEGRGLRQPRACARRQTNPGREAGVGPEIRRLPNLLF